MIIHIDTANQLDNSWNKDTVIGIYAEDNSLFVSIRIPSNLKLKIKDKLKDFQTNQVVNHLQAYLLFLACNHKESHFINCDIKRTWLCPDVRPIENYVKCLQKCFSAHGKVDLFQLLKIKIKKKNLKLILG